MTDTTQNSTPRLNRLIFGGSFDPPHLGHFRMMKYVLEEGITAKLDIAPALISPYKQEAPPTAANYRLQMLELGVAEILPEQLRRSYRIIENELKRKPPSYTIDTCYEISAEFNEQSLGLLIGSDSLVGLHEWKDAARLLNRFPVLVYLRPRIDHQRSSELIDSIIKSLNLKQNPFTILDNPLVDCSSVNIRAELYAIEAAEREKGSREMEAVKKRLTGCLPLSVMDYIIEQKLYCKSLINETK